MNLLNNSVETNNEVEVSYIVTAGGTANHYAVAIYDIEGHFLYQINRYRQPASLGIPRGLLQLDNNNLIIALDNTDRLESFLFDDFSFSSFFSGGTLSGNIYGLAKDNSNNILVIESNAIEKFSSEGAQVTPLYIGTTVGGCTLNGPRLMTVNSDDILFVSSYTNHRILRYDISSSTPSCLSSTATANNPYGVLLHSNSDFYYTTFGDDQIYRANPDGSNAVSIFTTNLTILNNPTAMLELPDGTIIIASSNTHTVERFDEDGNHLGTFIRDAQSMNIQDMTIMTRTEIVE